MGNEELVQFHSSAESLAGEITFRNMFRKAGFSEREIDGMILHAYLRKKLFREWAILAVFATCAFPFVATPLFGIRMSALVFFVSFAIVIVAVYALASYRSSVLARFPDQWTRKKGRTWTGVWERK